MSYQGPPSWNPNPPSEQWAPQAFQQQPQWQPPKPPKHTSAEVGAAVAGLVVMIGACCLFGRSKGDQVPAVTSAPMTAPAPAAATPEPTLQMPAAPSFPSVAELMSTVDMSDPMIARSYSETRSVEQGRMVVAQWALLGSGPRCGRGATTGSIHGRMFDRVRYVHPRCSPAWLARLLNCRMVYSDDRRPVHAPLFSGGFRSAECVRERYGDALAVYAVTP